MVVNQITVLSWVIVSIYSELVLYLRSSKADNIAAAYFDRCALYILLNYKNYISVRLAFQPRKNWTWLDRVIVTCLRLVRMFFFSYYYAVPYFFYAFNHLEKVLLPGKSVNKDFKHTFCFFNYSIHYASSKLEED